MTSPLHDTSGAATARDLRVSLVVPLRNEEQSLAALVDSIRGQTRPPDEIVLVDGGSTDRTVALARELTAGDPRFRIIEAGPATPGRGRNVGIAAATHDWIALTDAGIRLEPAWLERLVDVVQRSADTRIVYGNFEPVTDTFFEESAALAYVQPRAPRPGGRMRSPSVVSILVHREAWQAAGRFPDLRAAEDLMFIERLQRAGMKTGWAPDATVHWSLQPTLWRTFRRFTLYSKHNVWAGRQRDWHYGVARMYVVAAVFAVLGIVHSPWWLSALALGLGGRVFKSLWKRREGRGLLWLANPARFACVGAILLTIDAATLVGWVQARWRKPPTPAAEPMRMVEA